jgi:hypothetical protein
MHGIRTLAAIAVVLLVAACGESGPTPSGIVPEASGQAASPSPSLAPTPEPTPVDAAPAFVATLAGADFSATIAVTGETTLGSTTTTTTGTLEVSGSAFHLVLDRTTADRTTRVETLTGNGSRYSQADGLWFRSGEALTNSLVATLRAATGVRDTGIEARDGVLLHHLLVPTPVTLPIELGITDETVTHLIATIEAWAEEDGTPVRVTIAATWDQVVGGKAVAGKTSMELAFSGVGSPVSIDVPTDLWAGYTSRRFGYRMAHPVSWELKPGTTKFADTYFGPSDTVFASRARRFGLSLNGLNRQILALVRRNTGFDGVKIDSNEATKLNGVGARRIEFHGTDDGTPVWAIAVFAARGAFWYYVEYDTYEQTGVDDRALFDAILRSFRFR